MDLETLVLSIFQIINNVLIRYFEILLQKTNKNLYITTFELPLFALLAGKAKIRYEERNKREKTSFRTKSTIPFLGQPTTQCRCLEADIFVINCHSSAKRLRVTQLSSNCLAFRGNLAA